MLESKVGNQEQTGEDSATKAREEEAVAFEKFLTYLTLDREQAWERYDHLRNAAVRYSISQRAPDPYSCADEVLRILQKRIAEGEEIEHIEFYIIGITRNVLRRDSERRNKREVELPERESENVHSVATSPLKILEEKDEVKRRKKCLTMCLRDLPAPERALLEEHGLGNEHHKTERTSLAARLGITPVNLRVKVFRIKEKLKRCLASCLEKSLRKV